jgi:hypothetical protein
MKTHASVPSALRTPDSTQSSLASGAAFHRPHEAAFDSSGASGPGFDFSKIKIYSGSAQPLPYRDHIQAAFGSHDVAQVPAYVGGAAADAAKTLGARAFASGGAVAFRENPDLRTAAHEAAHVVQQRRGVQLIDGLGVSGDAYERHADAVADNVVAGRSAEPQLDAIPHSGGRPSTGVVQRVAATFKTHAEIEAMNLTEFDFFARDQADWATGAGVVDPDKTKLVTLLEFARKDANLVLGGLGPFNVNDLIVKGAGTGGTADTNFAAYCKACRNGDGPTVDIKDQAPTVDAASDWGAALRKLEATPGRKTINKVVKQESGPRKHNLQELVDGGFVDDFINYVTTVGPNLEAENGADLRSYVDLRNEAADPATYKATIPDVLDFHRFEKKALDGLVTNLGAAKSAKPLALILHSSLDWNGAFHRDRHLSNLITRPTHVTLMVEGKATLADVGATIAPLATKYKTDGKVDEVMFAGHGEFNLMELAGTTKDRVVNTEEDIKTGDPATAKLYTDVLNAMENSADARIVFNACLTNSNKVTVTPLDPDPKKAAVQIIAAIAADPSLATELRGKVTAAALAGQVLGANASFGSIALKDPSGKMDLRSGVDPQLTTPDKLVYAEFGTEPSGAVRAVLESWANDQAAAKTDTIDAVKRRVAAGSASTDWDESVIQAIYALIAAAPTNGQRINELEPAAGALSEAKSRENCRVDKIKPVVPVAHRAAIFAHLMKTTAFTTRDFIGALLFQVWMETDDGRKNSFIGHLGKLSFDTSTAADIVDLGHIRPMLGPKLLPPPPVGIFIRGEILLACLFLIQEGSKAPLEVKNYVAALVGAGQQHFPAGANIADVIKGSTEDEVLIAAGLKPKATMAPPPKKGPPPAAPTPNIDIGHTGTNTLFVEPLTQRAQPVKASIDVLDKPGGKKTGTVATGTTMNVIGKIDTFFAIEFAGDTAFVDAGDVTIL